VAIEARSAISGFELSPLSPRRTEEQLNRDGDLGPNEAWRNDRE